METVRVSRGTAVTLILTWLYVDKSSIEEKSMTLQPFFEHRDSF